MLLIRSLPSGSDYQERNWLQDNKNKFLSTDNAHQEKIKSIVPTRTQLAFSFSVDRSHFYHMFYVLLILQLPQDIVEVKIQPETLWNTKAVLEKSWWRCTLQSWVSQYKAKYKGKAQQWICICSNWRYITIFKHKWWEIIVCFLKYVKALINLFFPFQQF